MRSAARSAFPACTCSARAGAAPIALEYAARRPAGLASAILESPLVSTRSWLADANALRGRLSAETQRMPWARASAPPRRRAPRLRRPRPPISPATYNRRTGSAARDRGLCARLADPVQPAALRDHAGGERIRQHRIRCAIMTASLCSPGSTAPAPCSSPANMTRRGRQPWPASPSASPAPRSP